MRLFPAADIYRTKTSLVLIGAFLLAWASPARVLELGSNVCFPRAPEICIEILSPGNTETEMRDKTALYFDAGAQEVWHCTDQGRMIFFRAEEAAPSTSSQVCPSFPAQVNL